MSIQVSVNGTVIRPYWKEDKVDLSTKVHSCGANNYFFSERYVEFILTAEKNCIV